ncbi:MULTISPECIES: hypothetical protein [unclassified Achromobacter]|uniref:hypothetical protein n=1 Tax=unclassified Achromobacter TaxID=2626865 RepID=UPI0008D6AEEE|nr:MULTISPECIES: hypothetical protein [unclassified Achromobacter]SEJ96327.1 hypothetical protein SAMN03159494_04037 [Achromobacter sp. NFACC18-2]SIT27552.1 hypothetical protein SAMN05428937_3634 [Achromobacter sp. MFA1 R4]
MLLTDRNTTTSHAIGIELARRQALTLRCGFSGVLTRQLMSQAGRVGPAWAIGAHRETDKARGAKAFPFRIAATAAS